MSDDTLVRKAHARLVQYLGYVLPDAPRNLVNIYEHEGGFSFDDLRTIMQDRDESLVRLNQAESALTQCALALRPFATWDDGGEQDADFGEAAKALAACSQVLHEIPNEQGEQQRQAVGGNAEGKVPTLPPNAHKSPGSNTAAGAALDDTTRMDFLDSIGAPWKNEPKDGKRLLLVALPYKPLPGQVAPATIREAIDYILDCPESVERALDGKGIDLLSGKRSELTSDQFADVQRLNRMRRAIEWLLTFHPESPETGAELPKEAWAPEYREAVEYAQEAIK